jgi:CRP/FNR family transcriptional regulator, dissimilatory nitrate respiration regulator
MISRNIEPMPQPLHEIESLLTGISYLRDMSPQNLKELAAVSQRIECARGETIFREGSPAAGIFLIVRGRLRVVRAAADGREQVLHEEGRGATLAEVPVFDGGGYVGTAITSENATLVLVPRAPLLKAIQSSPACALAAMAVLAARVRRIAHLASELSFKPVIDRLAGYLVRESQRTSALTITLPETRDELASHIGTVREQVSRALSQLARAGVVEVQGRRLTIKNLLQLQAFAASDEDAVPG